MAKLKKQTVDYYSHYCVGTTALRVLQRKYRNNGYAVYYKLQDMLGSTPGHYIDCSNSDIWEDLLDYLDVSEVIATEIINLLTGGPFNEIDKELWENNRIIWQSQFIEKVKDVYSNRKAEIPARPEVNPTPNLRVGYEYPTPNLPVDYGKTTEQSKVKESKVNNNINVVPVPTVDQPNLPDNNTPVPVKDELPKYLEDFEEWYKLYPRKEGKFKAFINFKKILKEGKYNLEDLKRCAVNYAKVMAEEKRDIQYIKMADSFLSLATRRFEEYIQAKARDSPPKEKPVYHEVVWDEYVQKYVNPKTGV